MRHDQSTDHHYQIFSFPPKKHKRQTLEPWVYDSLFNGQISSLVRKQIAHLLYREGRSIKIVVQGVFAIAFLVSLLYGQNPSGLTLDDRAIRQHLLKCVNDPLGKTKSFSKQARIQIKFQHDIMLYGGPQVSNAHKTFVFRQIGVCFGKLVCDLDVLCVFDTCGPPCIC